jgi:hypothetical protein
MPTLSEFFGILIRMYWDDHPPHSDAPLYRVPGMAHCTGGPGPNNFGQPFSSVVLDAPVDHDMLASLEARVEAGRAPHR